MITFNGFCTLNVDYRVHEIRKTTIKQTEIDLHKILCIYRSFRITVALIWRIQTKQWHNLDIKKKDIKVTIAPNVTNCLIYAYKTFHFSIRRKSSLYVHISSKSKVRIVDLLNPLNIEENCAILPLLKTLARLFIQASTL